MAETETQEAAAAGGEVRVVLCPKCENLLPEVADFAVYQCGGCGAVLRAKNKSFVSDTFADKSDEESLARSFYQFSEKHGNNGFPKTGAANPVDGHDIDAKSNGSSNSRAAGEYRNGSITRAEKWVVEEDLELNKNRHGLGNSEISQGLEHLKLESGSTSGSCRSVRTLGWSSREKGEIDRFQNTQRNIIEGLGKSEVPSNYRVGSYYDYAELVNNMNAPGAVKKVECIEDDRAELLRKLDELKDQISRSGQMVDRSKEQVSLGRRVPHQDPYNSGPDNCFPDSSNKIPMKYSTRDNMAMHHNNYGDPSLQTSNQGFEDPLVSQSHMVRRAPQRAPEPFGQHPPQPYYTGQYINNDLADMDQREQYPYNRNLHHPSCSCFHCYNKLQQIPPPMAPFIAPNDRFSAVPNHPIFHHHEHPDGFAPREYNSRFSHYPSVNSRTSQWSSDVNSELGRVVRPRPRRVLLVTGRRCHPVAGGAPFVTCCNCFELLQLPKKVSSMGRTQKKMRCAACSEVIFVSVVSKRLVLSLDSEAEELPRKVDSRFIAVANESNSDTMGHAKWASMEFSSGDYDNSVYEFQSMDTRVVASPIGPSLSSNKTATTRSHHSTSSCNSDDQDREEHKASELVAIAKPSPPPSGSPLQEHFDYSTKYNRTGPGNRSGRSEVNKVMPPLKTTSRQNSVKEATEIEIHSNEYSNNTGISQESGDVSREGDQLRGNRGGESFFAGIIKNGFRDFSRSSQHVEQGQINVTVNGHPIPDRLVKKAENLAGRIQPGEYWYDSRAGFWGVIGGPCRGIIPPFIEEFNFPMPETCSGGNTGVFVNGRELHQKDLDLLGTRGLPTERDRSYIIEISGRVLDEDSGEELDSLGKLAPTVEKAKHGFGMKVPKAA